MYFITLRFSELGRALRSLRSLKVLFLKIKKDRDYRYQSKRDTNKKYIL